MTIAEPALAAALEHPGVCVGVIGAAGAGKSHAITEIELLAAAGGKTVIRAAPASGASDSGSLVLARVVKSLGGRVQGSDGWEMTIKNAHGLLKEHRENIVVLCDEPSRWSLAGGHFGRRAEEVADVLVGASSTWPSIVCDQSADVPKLLALPSADSTSLDDDEHWKELGAAAAALSTSDDAARFDTPLKQRLAVAIRAWDPDAELGNSHTSNLALQLAGILASHRLGRRLWSLWQRLALARVRLDDGTLNTLGAAALNPLGQATLSLVFLDGAQRLHDALRRIPEQRPVVPAMAAAIRADAHQVLFEYHREKQEQLATVNAVSASEHAAEALFHGGELKDETLIGLISADMSDQLNALGSRLSDFHQSFDSAQAVYLRATQANDRDGFAFHGVARTLDILGRDAATAEAQYKRALALEPLRPEWHAHYVTMLADLGRIDDAREAWSQAESSVLDGGSPPETYDSLHAYVATSLVAIGELSFAEYVLTGVPMESRNAEYRRIETWLRGRMVADEIGSFVPAPRSANSWWLEKPELLPNVDTDGRALTGWAAGRVESVGDDGVHLHLAYVEDSGQEPTRGSALVTTEHWAELCLDEVTAAEVTPGTFVEFGRYLSEGVGDRSAIRVLPLHRLPEGRYKPLDPQRWSIR